MNHRQGSMHVRQALLPELTIRRSGWLLCLAAAAPPAPAAAQQHRQSTQSSSNPASSQIKKTPLCPAVELVLGNEIGASNNFWQLVSVRVTRKFHVNITVIIADGERTQITAAGFVFHISNPYADTFKPFDK